MRHTANIHSKLPNGLEEKLIRNTASEESDHQPPVWVLIGGATLLVEHN